MNEPTQPSPRFVTVRALRNAAQALTSAQAPVARTLINIPVCVDLYPSQIRRTEVTDAKHP